MLLWPVHLLLGAISCVDLAIYRIPDVLVLGILGYRLIHPVGFTHIASFLLMACVLFALKRFFKRRSPMLGLGDVKLMMCCALFLTPLSVGFFLSASGLFGVLLGCLRGPRLPIPFAPAIWGAMTLLSFFQLMEK